MLELYILSLCLIGINAFIPLSHDGETRVAEKLIFTDYIQSGNLKTARDLSLVTGLTPNITSYAGFFKVNETCDSNLFFWFFPSLNDPSTDPLSIYLEGGPGSSSLFGLTASIGPYNLRSDGELELRELTWTRNSSMIFIDNPVGTGYSYTGSEDCYAADEARIGREVLSALEQFFVVFPEYVSNDFYITGESYAGHYIPAVAYAIHNADSQINLKGIAIGNGWIDPENQLLYSSHLYQLGLVDVSVRDLIADMENLAKEAIQVENYTKASTLWNVLLTTIIPANTGFGLEIYNFVKPIIVPDFTTFATREDVRAALHVGNTTWHGTISTTVSEHLFEDLTRSYRPWLESILDNYKVLLYNGQLDAIVPYSSTENMMQKLKWSHSEEYRTANRQIWRIGSDIAGYVKSAGNFTEILIRNAGHMAPQEQPLWCLEMYNKFISNEPIV